MAKATIDVSSQVPDNAGRFGRFGGRYVPETLIRALDQLTIEYDKACQDAKFQSELASLFKHYVGRPSPLYHAPAQRAMRRSPDLAQARRPQPHRRT